MSNKVLKATVASDAIDLECVHVLMISFKSSLKHNYIRARRSEPSKVSAGCVDGSALIGMNW